MTQTELIGGNVWEQALHRHLITHADEERDLLDEYQRAAADSHSLAFGYLVSLIVDDERRHHAMFAALVETLQTEVDRGPEAFAVPRLGHWGFERARILELTETFLAQENKDAAQLGELAAELEPVRDTTMWHLLVRLMQTDTSKHVQILEFVKAQILRDWDPCEADWSGIEKTGRCAF